MSIRRRPRSAGNGLADIETIITISKHGPIAAAATAAPCAAGGRAVDHPVSTGAAVAAPSIADRSAAGQRYAGAAASTATATAARAGSTSSSAASGPPTTGSAQRIICSAGAAERSLAGRTGKVA